MLKNKIPQIIIIIGNYLKRNKYLIFLIIMAIGGRCLYPLTGSFSFVFDQGKDGLNALDLLVNHQPKLIGPWTSIPGLYFGPAWYYFLGLFLCLGGLSPVAPIWGMIALGILQIILVYHYFGRTAATCVTAGTAWLMVTVSAWNPYPLPLITWCILILLRKTYQNRQLTLKRACFFGFWAGLGFHFSSAYAIFYPVIILLCWFKQRLIISKNTILAVIIGFVLPFTPQLLFEIRHHWSETQAVFSYLRGGGEPGDALSWAKVWNVISQTWGELRLSAFPDLIWPGQRDTPFLSGLFVVVWLVLFVYFIWQVKKKRCQLPPLWCEAWLFILLPTFGFCFLHFNVWYVVGMLPAAVLIVSSVLEQFSTFWQITWCSALILGLFAVNYREFRTYDLGRINTFYRQVARAWQTVKQASEGRNFALYTYRGDVYDFNYQYLIITDALRTGQPLPVEFIYRPGAPTYIDFKDRLIDDLPTQTGEPEYLFYLVENSQSESPTFAAWRAANPDFARAQRLAVIGEGIEVWRATASSEARLVEATSASELY